MPNPWTNPARGRQEAMAKEADGLAKDKMKGNKKRSYAEVMRKSRYQDEGNIGASTREERGAGG